MRARRDGRAPREEKLFYLRSRGIDVSAARDAPRARIRARRDRPHLDRGAARPASRPRSTRASRRSTGRGRCDELSGHPRAEPVAGRGPRGRFDARLAPPAPLRSAPGSRRVPDPHALGPRQAPRLPRQRGDDAEAARRARRPRPPTTCGRTRTCTAGVHLLSQEATLAYDARAGDRAAVPRRRERAGDRLHARHDGVDQPRRAGVGSREPPRRATRSCITTMEHHSNIVPWQMVGRGDAAPSCARSRSRTRASSTWTRSTRSSRRGRARGDRPREQRARDGEPVGQIVKAAHAVGAKVLVDGGAVVQHLKIDVAGARLRLLAFSGHKLYGPTGIGVLYGRKALLEAMPPWQGGGDMIRTVSLSGFDVERPPLQVRGGHARHLGRDRARRGDRVGRAHGPRRDRGARGRPPRLRDRAPRARARTPARRAPRRTRPPCCRS